MNALCPQVRRTITWLTCLLSLLLVCLTFCLLSSSGGSSVGTLTPGTLPLVTLPPGAPPQPTPSDPWYGTAGNVLVRENDTPPIYTWIGFSSQANWQHYLDIFQQASQMGSLGIFMGGPVIVNSTNPLGFYFYPKYTDAEIVAPVVQWTSVLIIEGDSACYSQNPAPGFIWLAPVDPIYPQTLSNQSSPAAVTQPKRGLSPGMVPSCGKTRHSGI